MWLRLNMTEKLFTGTLNKNKTKTKKTYFMNGAVTRVLLLLIDPRI